MMKKKKHKKGTKKIVVKRKLKFEDYKKCLKVSQIIDAVKYFGKKGINFDSLKEDKKEFIKSQEIFKGERVNVFTEEINKIALSSNNDKIK